jgi:hypothetical protein
MRNAFVAVFALAAATPCFASESWNVAEGPGGAQKGAWSLVISGASVTGEAKMTGPHGEAVGYRVVGRLDKGVLTLTRLDPTDRRDCFYHGVMSGDGSVSGSATCAGQQGPWIVRRARK